MKTLCTTILLLLSAGPGGEREKGLKLYEQGRYEEAAAAFRLAIASEGGESAELQYNLALASWRAGDLATAETAVEKYAALADPARTDLHAGLLGGVRYEEAKGLEDGADEAVAAQEDPLPILKQALGKAEQARDHFVRGAASTPSPELLRNTERTLRYIEELKKKIEELEKQREEQQDNEDQNKDENKDEKNENEDEKKPEENEQEKGEGEQGEQEKGEPKPSESEPEEGSQEPNEPPPNEQPEGGKQQPGEQPPEPEQQSEEPGETEQQDPAGEPPPENQPENQSQNQPEPQPRNDAPGEAAEGRELSPEQTQRLLEQLKDLEKTLKALRGRAVTGRKPVERDW